jgi:hypothetical protein
VSPDCCPPPGGIEGCFPDTWKSGETIDPSHGTPETANHSSTSVPVPAAAEEKMIFLHADRNLIERLATLHSPGKPENLSYRPGHVKYPNIYLCGDFFTHEKW